MDSGCCFKTNPKEDKGPLNYSSVRCSTRRINRETFSGFLDRDWPRATCISLGLETLTSH
jgi:uncharacterized cysteine cluster protein YcgN (CxxCxxCC family)